MVAFFENEFSSWIINHAVKNAWCVFVIGNKNIIFHETGVARASSLCLPSNVKMLLGFPEKQKNAKNAKKSIAF